MTVEISTVYPKEISNAAWQKQKSFKDKTRAATKTGLGAELLKAEAAWKDIPFNTLSAKNFKPQDSVEATRNLENAQFVMNLKVKKALAALKTANKQAVATGQNSALSPKAQAAAKAIASKLELTRLLLTTVNVNDFKLAITQVQAASKGGSALQSVSLLQGNTLVGVGKKGIRNPDKTVSVYEITWKPAAGDPKALLQHKLTVRSHNEDDSVYLNDMTFDKLSSTGKTATLK